MFDMRPKKLEVPIFKGEVSENPDGGLHWVECYFVVNCLTKKGKLDALVL